MVFLHVTHESFVGDVIPVHLVSYQFHFNIILFSATMLNQFFIKHEKIGGKKS